MKQYAYAQSALFYWAAESNDTNILSKAAQAVYHWPSFARLMGWKPEEDNDDKSVISIDIIKLKKQPLERAQKKITTKKSKPLSKQKENTKVKGESISDDFQTMEPAITPNEKSKKESAKAKKKKSNALIAKASKNLSSQLKKKTIQPKKKKAPKSTIKAIAPKAKKLEIKPTAQNWKAWSRAKSKNESLCGFTIWLNQKNQKAQSKSTTMSAPIKSIDKAILKSKIKKSIKFNSQVISAPLAKLLANQGHTKEAIKMYQKLSLIFPEKSSFFAAEISTLKKK